MALTDDERLAYLNEEVEKVISMAPANQVLKLRALQARMNGIRSRVKDPQVRLTMIANEMMASFNELNEVLKGVTGSI